MVLDWRIFFHYSFLILGLRISFWLPFFFVSFINYYYYKLLLFRLIRDRRICDLDYKKGGSVRKIQLSCFLVFLKKNNIFFQKNQKTKKLNFLLTTPFFVVQVTYIFIINFGIRLKNFFPLFFFILDLRISFWLPFFFLSFINYYYNKLSCFGLIR